MGLIDSVLLAVFGLLAAILVPVATRLITDDVKEWLPWIRNRLIERAVRRLPEIERERYAEEWRSHVSETPGDLSKLLVALGLGFAARSITDVIYSDGSAPVSESTQKRVRRGIDILLSMMLMAILLPTLLFAALLIKLESCGPVFYRHERIGLNGRPFWLLKLRTMRFDAQIDGDPGDLRRDPRVTRVGRLLRNANIDQVPQLINVLRGDMSFVGPRPRRKSAAEKQTDLQGDELPAYMRAKPGITGLDRLGDRFGPIETSDIEGVQSYDDYYVKNRSLWLDLRILIQTVIEALRTRPPF